MTPPGPVRSLCLLALIAFVAPHEASAQEQTSKVDRAVREALRTGARTQRVIITVAPGHRGDIRQALEAHGDRVNSEHPSLDALTVDIHSGDVNELAQHPWVAAVSADATVDAGSVTPGLPLGRLEDGDTGRTSVDGDSGAPTLRQLVGVSDSTWSGAGIGVAIVDSGISARTDFAGRITAFYDFTHGGVATKPYDDYGHGTHIAGLIGSSGASSSTQYQGIAPQVRFVGLKVLDQTGKGKTSQVIQALEYVIANRIRLGVQIVNLSLGHPIYAPAKYDPLVQAVEKASAAGLIVVTSAGNFGRSPVTSSVGYAGITSPGNAPSAITVGAGNSNVTLDRQLHVVTSYSSRGPSWFDGFAKPDVVAPGHHLVSNTDATSWLYKQLPKNRVTLNGEPFLDLSGTSMAAAVTSGVVALMLEANRADAGWSAVAALRANGAKALLEYSATTLPGADTLAQGAGEINAAGALALQRSNTGSWGRVWSQHYYGEGYTTIGGTSYAWAGHVIWRDQVLTGSPALVTSILGTNVVWGTQILWGSSVQVIENVVWGTAARTWATNLAWPNRVIGLGIGDNVVWGTAAFDNVVWGTMNHDNVVWGTTLGDNVVWGTWRGDNVVWGTSRNVVWGTALDNVLWGTYDNVLWGTSMLSILSGGR